VAGDYTLLGVDHILSGYDHLTFVLALLLIVSGTHRLILTVTSFTLAHSITLAAATLGLMWVPGPPVEATISLSILFLASELVKVNRGQASLTATYPWIVAFAFGLLHGFGFAGALNDIGLPENEIALALLMFNVGVEVGQLLFVAIVLVLLMALRKVRHQWPAWVYQVPAYSIGSVAALWFIDRVAGNVFLLCCLVSGVTFAEGVQTVGADFAISKDNVPQKEPVYSPYVGQSHPNRVYWGDTHVHTSYSWDAGLVGNTLGPDEAYRFAKGQEVRASSGQPVKLVRPLDWLVVADHAESLGVAVLIERSDPAILASEVGRKTHDLYKKGEIYDAFETWGFNVIVKGNNPLTDESLTRSVWEEIIDEAEAHNQPGAFTAFIGYEWSSAPPHS